MQAVHNNAVTLPMPQMERQDSAVLPEKSQEPVTSLSKAKVVEKNTQSIAERLAEDPDYRSVFIGGVNAALHTLATVTSFAGVDKQPIIKALNKFIDTCAFVCTKYVAPISSYGYAAWEAWKNKKGVEVFIKAIPPLLLPFVGASNIDTVYGLSTGLNAPYDRLVERITEKSKESAAYAAEVNKNFTSNAKIVWSEFKEWLSDFKAGKIKGNEKVYFYNCPMILAGSIPMLLFARHARDTIMAKGLGLLRNIGGILGDVAFFFEKDLRLKLVGVFCSLAACANIGKRWVKSEATGRLLIHSAAALDVAGISVWNAYSGQQKKAAAMAA